MALHPPLPSGVRVVRDGALPRVVISTEECRAEVFFQGAHLTQWPHVEPERSVFWTSPLSAFQPGKAIRGGVPICFPWFGPHPSNPSAPAHGFARLLDWSLVGAADDREGVTLEFALEQTDPPQPGWPHLFHARYQLTLASRLTLALTIENRGVAPFSFEAAFHSYFAVGDVESVILEGLENTSYLDKPANFARREQGHEPITFHGEIDRVYLDTRAECRLRDPRRQRLVRIEKSNSRSTVVWNPGADRARAMRDIGESEWRQMVCVETANVGDARITLAPGETHTMTANVAAEPL